MTNFGELRLMLYASDYTATCHFYGETLGLSVRESWDGPTSRGTMFTLGAHVIEVFDDTRGPVVGVGTSIEVDDVHALWDRLYAHTDVVFALRHNAWGDTSFCVRDPNGFELTFFTLD